MALSREAENFSTLMYVQTIKSGVTVTTPNIELVEVVGRAGTYTQSFPPDDSKVEHHARILTSYQLWINNRDCDGSKFPLYVQPKCAHERAHQQSAGSNHVFLSYL